MITAVLFDMDGVLIDSEPLHHKTDMILLSELGVECNESYLDQFVGMTNPEMWEQIIKSNNIRANRKKILAKQMHLKLKYLKRYPYSPIEGVVGILTELSRKKIKVGVASSSSRIFIKKVLKKLKIKRYIQEYYSGEDVPNGKPAPDIFIKVAKLLRVRPQECLVIEDSKNGVLAAKRAGMRTIGYQNPNSGNQDLSEADIVISDFNKLNISEILQCGI